MRESTQMWNERARREAHNAWESYVAERQRRTLERQRLYGADGRDGEAASKRALAQLKAIEDEKKAKALLVSTAASLTPSPTVSEPSPSEISVAVVGSTGSVPSGPTPTESASTPISTANSRKISKRTGSKSRPPLEDQPQALLPLRGQPPLRCQTLMIPYVPVIVCNYDDNRPPCSGLWAELHRPIDVLAALGAITEVGVFEVSHERIDLHNVVPL